MDYFGNKGLEKLAKMPFFVAPISYDDKSKSSFIEGIRVWSVNKGTEVRERIVGIVEGIKSTVQDAYAYYCKS